VKYGINHKAVKDTCYNGYGTLIGSMDVPTDPWYQDLTGNYPYNPTKAKQLLAASGEANQTIRLTVPTIPTYEQCGQVVQSELQAARVQGQTRRADVPATWLQECLHQR